jgi:isopropylmalate/homocitrate/citramalate synthase
MLLDLCLKAAEQIMREVEGAKSNEEALQSLGQKAKYVKQHLLEPGAKTIHAEKYSELLQILKAAQILVATRGKSFLDRVYDAVFGRTSKVKAEIDNVEEQLKDWVDVNAPSRHRAPAPVPASAPASAAPAPTGEHLT